MRGTLLVLSGVYVALVACGSEVTASDDGGGDGATNDAPSDGNGDAASTTDAGSDASDGGADGGDAETPVTLHLKCAEGDQCEAGKPVCCATLDFGNDCVLDSVSTACAAPADCPTTLEPFCTQTEMVRFCDNGADCTEPDYDRCCTFNITGHSQSVVMCASEAMAEAADASCAP